jgi:hypothetical protein
MCSNDRIAHDQNAAEEIQLLISKPLLRLSWLRTLAEFKIVFSRGKERALFILLSAHCSLGCSVCCF